MTITDLGDAGANQVFCWSCDAPVSPRALFCSACGAIQAPADADHFARLGLPRSYAVDPDHLDHQYEGFRRRLDPERFAKRSAKERHIAEDHVARLSAAYETLKDPFRRGACLLHLAGRSAEVDKAGKAEEKAAGAVRDLRQDLAQAHGAEALAGLVGRVEFEATRCQASLAEAFAAGDLDQAVVLTARLGCFARVGDEARTRRAQLMRQGL